MAWFTIKGPPIAEIAWLRQTRRRRPRGAQRRPRPGRRHRPRLRVVACRPRPRHQRDPEGAGRLDPRPRHPHPRSARAIDAGRQRGARTGRPSRRRQGRYRRGGAGRCGRPQLRRPPRRHRRHRPRHRLLRRRGRRRRAWRSARGSGRPDNIQNIVKRGWWPAQIAAGLSKTVVDGKGQPIVVGKYTGLHAARHFYASWCINAPEAGVSACRPRRCRCASDIPPSP